MRRVGSLGTHSQHHPARVRPDLFAVVPCRVEGLEKIPTDGGALLVAIMPGPSHLTPVIMHGIEKELGRPVYGMATTSSGPSRWSARCGPEPAVWPPGRTMRIASPRPGATGARLPRRHQGSVQVLHRSLPASSLWPRGIRGDRHASRRAVIPIAVTGSEEAMPRCSASRRLEGLVSLLP